LFLSSVARRALRDGDSVYGYYEAQVTVAQAQTAVLRHINWLSRIDHEHEVTIASPTTSEVVITNPGPPGHRGCPGANR
jgi:hypothetical protein